ncbi:MAG: hypothetical protein NZM25_04265 [Leptospiraceae bacterium]|nr:hypothetical protein [Leptospiraceae bacterium]MDW8305772.1 hypothetical protein [Leptospiraceae bacterium]
MGGLLEIIFLIIAVVVYLLQLLLRDKNRLPEDIVWPEEPRPKKPTKPKDPAAPGSREMKEEVPQGLVQTQASPSEKIPEKTYTLFEGYTEAEKLILYGELLRRRDPWEF